MCRVEDSLSLKDALRKSQVCVKNRFPGQALGREFLLSRLWSVATALFASSRNGAFLTRFFRCGNGNSEECRDEQVDTKHQRMFTLQQKGSIERQAANKALRGRRRASLPAVAHNRLVTITCQTSLPPAGAPPRTTSSQATESGARQARVAPSQRRALVASRAPSARQSAPPGRRCAFSFRQMDWLQSISATYLTRNFWVAGRLSLFSAPFFVLRGCLDRRLRNSPPDLWVVQFRGVGCGSRPADRRLRRIHQAQSATEPDSRHRCDNAISGADDHSLR